MKKKQFLDLSLVFSLNFLWIWIGFVHAAALVESSRKPKCDSLFLCFCSDFPARVLATSPFWSAIFPARLRASSDPVSQGVFVFSRPPRFRPAAPCCPVFLSIFSTRAQERSFPCSWFSSARFASAFSCCWVRFCPWLLHKIPVPSKRPHPVRCPSLLGSVFRSAHHAGLCSRCPRRRFVFCSSPGTRTRDFQPSRFQWSLVPT
jgi:hypothetical protein